MSTELPDKGALLTLNCHEAWVHQLEYLARPLHIIDGLSGRYTKQWDRNVRPLPEGARLIGLDEARAARAPYQCIIAHSVSDLLDIKTIAAPRILVLHGTLDGRMEQEGLRERPEKFVRSIERYCGQLGIHVVAVSELKRRSWGIAHEVISSGADPDRYPEWNGHLAMGLRIANQISARARVLLWDFHEAAFAGIPLRIIGHNPDLPGIAPSQSWDDLKQSLSSHRFYVHTAEPALEDGYNMAMLEAMAAGLPVLSNRHASSPVEHGINGFVSDRPLELAGFARLLLSDRELARKMGAAARETIQRSFHTRIFAARFAGAIAAAQASWRGLPG